MVQVDLPGAFAAGQIFAFLSRGYLKKEKRLFMHRLMGPMAVYFALLFAPAGLFLLICWPAWECMYRWEWVEKPAGSSSVSFFYVGFYMAMVVIGCASYMLAHRLYRQGKDRTVKRLCAASVIVTLLPFFLRPFTWYYVGTYAQYHALPRQTATFGTPSFFFSWLGAMGYFIIAAVFFGLWLKRKSKILEV